MDRQLPARAIHNQRSPMLVNWLQAPTHEGPLADRLTASAIATATTNNIAIAIAGVGSGVGVSTSAKKYTEEIHGVMKEIERVLGFQLRDSPARTERAETRPQPVLSASDVEQGGEAGVEDNGGKPDQIVDKMGGLNRFIDL